MHKGARGGGKRRRKGVRCRIHRTLRKKGTDMDTNGVCMGHVPTGVETEVIL